MNIRSLGRRTDLIFAKFSGSVIDKGRILSYKRRVILATIGATILFLIARPK